MNSLQRQLLSAFDGHDVDAIRSALRAGVDARDRIEGKLPIEWLLEEYTRSDRLPSCLRLLIDYGATFKDELLLAVLMNDGDAIATFAQSTSTVASQRVTLRSAFCSMHDVPLLHVAVEYGNLNSVRALLAAGAEVNARAGKDEDGMNGHTAIFHCVNTAFNRGQSILKELLDAGADTTIRLDGLWWGKSYEWETLFFDVTPVSFCQMGLMPQVHRSEEDIYQNITLLLAARGSKVPILMNVPNRYLSK